MKKIDDEELEDMLTELDPPYESKQELEIGRLLDQYGIPFFYKQPMILYNGGRNEIYKPSFTLMSYGGLVIDYVPNSDGKELFKREQLYRYNQIPAILIGPRSLSEPHWDRTLYHKLQQTYRQTLGPIRYTPAPVEK